jgi:hypothetical protein
MKYTMLVVILIASCSPDETGAPVKPKGSRQVGIHITQAELNNYDTEFLRAKSAGIDVVPLTLPWGSLETGTGFDFTFLEIINLYYPAYHTKVALNITPIYAVSRSLPPDLLDNPFDDPLVISRFTALLDSIHQKLPDTQINNFTIGLEVDLYLISHPSEWDSYKTLYTHAVARVKQLWGNSMPVGVETTWSAAVHDARNNIINLNEPSDMMVLSYYPNQSDFTVKPPKQVHEDIEAVIELYPDIPVFIIECGYQTSAACNSSYEKQKQFIVEMFRLWDKHNEKINFMGFLWLTDLSDANTDKYVEDYGMSGFPHLNAFKGYLQTTGLRTYPGTGTDKPGFKQLKSELKKRGW